MKLEIWELGLYIGQCREFFGVAVAGVVGVDVGAEVLRVFES